MGGTDMVTNMQAPILCECIDTRIGTIKTAGGLQPVCIMQLHSDAIPEPLIKFLNCNSVTKGQYKVPPNSDFAKLYRSTLGTNPTKRFSEAHKILRHFSGCWFIAKYERAQLKKGQQYLKVIHIEPENPARNDAWTLDGTLKKTAKKATFMPTESEDNQGIIRGQSGDNQGIIRGQSGDGETLDDSNSLGLEAVFHPTKKRPNQGKSTNTLDHVCDADLFVNLTDTAQGFYNDRLKVLLKNFGFESSEAETLAMQAVSTKYGQAAYLSKQISQQNNDEWLAAFNGMEQATWN